MNIEETCNDDNNLNDRLNQTKISIANSLSNVNDEFVQSKKYSASSSGGSSGCSGGNGNNVNNVDGGTDENLGRVAKWATGFDKLLGDPLGLEIFTVI
jgi:hypothetical protein